MSASGIVNRAKRRAMRELGCALAVAVALAGAEAASGQSACNYSVNVVTGPPCFPDPNLSVRFEGINEQGQTCGSRGKCGAVGETLPIVWTPELGLITLPLPPGATEGEAVDINNVLGIDGFGQVVCTLTVPKLEGERAYLYDDGVWTDLGLLPGALLARPYAINDATEIVGECDYPFGLHPFRAFHWQNDVMSEIDVPIGPESSAGCINEVSEIAGWMGAAVVDSYGFVLFEKSLDTIPRWRDATSSEAMGINIWGVVTGVSRIAVKDGQVPRRSWIYQNGLLTDLGLFSGTLRNIVEDVNDARHIVGVCFDSFGDETPYLWQDGDLFELEVLVELPPAISGLSSIKAVNNLGQLAGNGGSVGGGGHRGIILTPVARPLGDVDINCKVDAWDLALLLGDWGPCAEAGSCMSDFVNSQTFQPPGDGVVDAADLAIVLGNWSPQNASRRN